MANILSRIMPTPSPQHPDVVVAGSRRNYRLAKCGQNARIGNVLRLLLYSSFNNFDLWIQTLAVRKKRCSGHRDDRNTMNRHERFVSRLNAVAEEHEANHGHAHP